MARKKASREIFRPERWFNQTDFLKAARSGEQLVYGRNKRGRLEVDVISNQELVKKLSPTEKTDEKPREIVLLLRNTSKASPFHVLLDGVFIGTIPPGESIQVLVQDWKLREQKIQRKQRLEIRDFVKKKRWFLGSNQRLFRERTPPFKNTSNARDTITPGQLEDKKTITAFKQQIDLFQEHIEQTNFSLWKTPQSPMERIQDEPPIKKDLLSEKQNAVLHTFLIHLLFPEIITLQEQIFKTTEKKPEQETISLMYILLNQLVGTILNPTKKRVFPPSSLETFKHLLCSIEDKVLEKPPEKILFLRGLEKPYVPEKLIKVLTLYCKRLDLILKNSFLRQRFLEFLRRLLEKLGLDATTKIIFELLQNLGWYDDYLRHIIYSYIHYASLPSPQQNSHVPPLPPT